MRPIICCISEGLSNDENFAKIRPNIIGRVRQAAECGITHFQIREKHLSADNLFILAKEAAEEARQVGVKLMVNDRLDIALAAEADGVHLPAYGLPTEKVRSALPEGMIVGVSTHEVEEVLLARDSGADFAVFGPVFASPGKGDGIGLGSFAAVCQQAEPFPVVALGGIRDGNVHDVLNCGAAGYAAIRYLNSCIDAGRGAAPTPR